MDSFLLLTDQLRLNPLAEDLRLMWRDEYMNRYDCSPEDAKRECAHVWVPALEAWEQESAAVLVHSGLTVSYRTGSLVRGYWMPGGRRLGHIAVGMGWRPPTTSAGEVHWVGAVVGINGECIGAPIRLHRLRGEPAQQTILVGAKWLLAKAASAGIPWVYPTPAELHQKYEEYERTKTAATGPADGDQGEDQDNG